MTFDEYQIAALRTAQDKNKKNEIFHLILGLVGESGEVAEKVKKWVRDQDSDEALLDADDLAKELGDILWYVSVTASHLDISLDDLATGNIAKLADRQKRGTLPGSGDDR